MKRSLAAVGILAGLLLGITVGAQAIQYQGSLTGNGGGIVATDGWNSTSTIFSWTVTDVGTSGGFILWKYDYTFTVPTKDISHMIIEVSPNSGQSDFSAGTWDVYSSADGNSNPNMPSAMTGLKFPGASTTLSLSFTTTLSPVWGDFYAKDGVYNPPGSAPKIDVTAWNAGFSNPDTDPNADPANGSVDYHILRPDTKQTLVPEPGILLLVGAGLVALVGFGRKKR